MHTIFSDGSCSVEDMARSALERGLSQITITDHMPLPFATRYAVAVDQLEKYRRAISDARQKYSGRLQINMGLEIEFIPELLGWISTFTKMKWDYLLVSIHHLQKGSVLQLVNGNRNEFCDLLKLFDNNPRLLCERYYHSLQEAVSTGLFDIVGHMDVVAKHNARGEFWDESSAWYKKLVYETLDLISRHNMTVEINTGGFSQPAGRQYPDTWILREALGREIPLVLSSDSHSRKALAQHFDQIGDR
jgi:histidinol-phosphatase (PHP family)